MTNNQYGSSKASSALPSAANVLWMREMKNVADLEYWGLKPRSLSVRAWEFTAGASLAFVLLTGSRFAPGIGIGEIGLSISVLVGILRSIGNGKFLFYDDAWRLPVYALVYISLILFPITLVGVLAETPGTSMRDWFAYALSLIFVLSLRVGRADASFIGRAFLCTLAVILLYQYLYGGSLVWFSNRFTGGAKNPNQLALYCACAALVSIVAFERYWWRIISIGYFLVFGLLAKSDAYHAALAVVVALGAVSGVISRRHILSFGLLISLGAVVLVSAYGGVLDGFLGGEWKGADEGGERATLYVHGLMAWLHSPLSFFLGNGAGNFSGISRAFGGSEAHDTPIDLLTIGGLVGVIVLYWYPLRFAFQAYASRRVILLAFYGGLLIFSLFHFVARQPVWWFSIYIVSWSITRERELSRELALGPVGGATEDFSVSCTQRDRGRTG